MAENDVTETAVTPASCLNSDGHRFKISTTEPEWHRTRCIHCGLEGNPIDRKPFTRRLRHLQAAKSEAC